MKSSNWYPIINAKQLADDVKIIEVTETKQIIEYLTN